MAKQAESWPTVLAALQRRQDLSTEAAQWAMGQIMTGDATDAQIAGFAMGLRSKGESPAEMRGLATAMLQAAHRIQVPEPSVDVVGTGGDRSHSVNISTMAALVVAGTGARVVKHGNRAASSSCGAADVLEELGVDLSLPPDRVASIATEVGITFCFAQVFHPAMRHTASARRELGVPTPFNFLGPLTNPAQPTAQAVGCADSRMAGVMAEVFADRGVSALVFRGDDGLDELTVSTTSAVWLVSKGQVVQTSLDPTDLGIARAPLESLRGGDRRHNAEVVRRVLAGEERGAIRDAVVLNAAAALAALDESAKTPDALLPALKNAVQRAGDAIDSGAAAQSLDRWVAVTQAG